MRSIVNHGRREKKLALAIALVRLYGRVFVAGHVETGGSDCRRRGRRCSLDVYCIRVLSVRTHFHGGNQ